GRGPADPDAPTEEVEAPEGDGLDQGAAARVEEQLGGDATDIVKLPPDPLAPKPRETSTSARPLVGPPDQPLARTYAVIGISTRGKKGPLSKRVLVPLVDPPAPPAAPTIQYTESTITGPWPPAILANAAPSDLLPSRPLGPEPPAIAYNVYDTTNPESLVKLTAAPVAETTYSDKRITWGAKRCYAVRSAVRIGA